MAVNEPILHMRKVSKTFFGMKALSDVELIAYPGEVHALMGENGAGKSTLVKVLSGAYRPDPGGEIRIEGKAVRIDGPLAGRTAGISIIYHASTTSTSGCWRMMRASAGSSIEKRRGRGQRTRSGR